MKYFTFSSSIYKNSEGPTILYIVFLKHYGTNGKLHHILNLAYSYATDIWYLDVYIRIVQIAHLQIFLL